MTTPYSLIYLEAENFKRLKLVRIDFDGKSVVLGGANEAGKSSVLDAVETLIRGKKFAPEEPIRRGQETARLVGQIGDLTITRTFEKDGESKIVITSPEGAKYSSPQAMLDKLLGELSFDPLAFTRMKPREQYETLAGLVGIDFTLLDRNRQTAFEKRTDVNRDVKKLQAQIAGMPFHKEAPADVVSITDLSDAIKAAEVKRTAAEVAKRASDEAERAVDAATARAAALEEQEIELKREHDAEVERHRIALEQIHQRDRARREALAKELDALPDLRTRAKEAADAMAEAVAAVPDTAPLHTRIAEAEGTNRLVRENAARKAIDIDLAEEAAKAEALTAEIESIDKQKLDLVAKTKFPVDGLSVRDGAVTFDDFPFDQASQARKLRVACAICLALNPKLRLILIREGAFLDDEAMKQLADFAEQNKVQCLIERVGDGAEVGIVIEDGEVREVRQPVAAE